ncbi:MAG: helix-turn-helix domain-containing protein [Solirubrobacterales bacterium]
MADIGSTLRDTRIRKKIDIGAVEEATKIRAKYLRALENEEWQVLPGPTYVKSFVRTYAEFLGLDPYILIEEYNTRFEEPEELELPAFAGDAPLRRQVVHVPRPSRLVVAIVLGVAFVGLLLVLGLTSGGDDSKNKSAATTPADKTPVVSPARSKSRANANSVEVTVVPKRDVWVCLVDASGDVKVDGRVVSARDNKGPYRSRRFRVTIGNGGGDLRINGKLYNIPETARPLGYAVSTSGVRRLPAAKSPTCGQ